MTRIDRTGQTPGVPGERGPKGPEQKKKKGPSFDELLEKGSEKTAKKEGAPGQEGVRPREGEGRGKEGGGGAGEGSAGGGAGGRGGPESGEGKSPLPGESKFTGEGKGPGGPAERHRSAPHVRRDDPGDGAKPARSEFGAPEGSPGRRGETEKGPGFGRRTADGPPVEKKKDTDEAPAAYAPSQAGESAPVRGAAPAEQAAPIPRDLVNKVVESVRVGQNREGAAEVQLDLKATMYEGMSVKVSGGKGAGVTATLIVDQISAKNALEREIGELAQRLEAKGLQVSEIRVELREQAAPAQGEARGSGEGESGSGAHADGGSGGPGGGGGGGGGGGRTGGGGPSTPGRGEKEGESRTDYSL